ncbi:MAG TPA: methionyl-tRNA formyltransferase [Clostridia bacterium]|nr:methionyl-tRNA formyltransferase [Clostridia bacterium]
MRIAFLGTPDFALPSLEMLIGAEHELCVFTQPDRPAGRHGELTPPPVKVMAEQRGIPVRQFEKIRSAQGVAALRAFAPELMVTAAFGQLLSQENLDIPTYGCVNVHASLLPKYRGAAPIQWAIIEGERVTGVTTMLTELGLDTGDILLFEQTEIGPDETAGELFKRLSALGAKVLKETIERMQNGTLTRAKQDEALASKCRMINKEDGRIDFSQSAQKVHDLVRGANPWPCAYALLDGEPIKIWKTRMTQEPPAGEPGLCAVADPRRGLYVDAGDGLVEILEMQFPGARRMDAKTALLGHPLAGRRLR